MFSDCIMCFQVFCFHWITSQQIASLIEKRKLAHGVFLSVEFVAMLAQNLKEKSAVLTDIKWNQARGVDKKNTGYYVCFPLQTRHSCLYYETPVV